MEQTNLLENMVKFNNKSKPKTKEGKDKKRNTFGSVNAFYGSRGLTLNDFRSEIFRTKAKQGKGRPRMLASRPSHLSPVALIAKISDHSNLKILIPKQIIQRLPIALALVKAGNTSGNLLSEIKQIIYSLYRIKEITKKYIII